MKITLKTISIVTLLTAMIGFSGWQINNPTGSGTVTSVAGTANQIAVATGTTTAVVSITNPFTFPGTVSNDLSIFGATTSAQLSGVLSDETGSGGVAVFNSSPTIVTPTIASFVNATHTHANAAGGGTLDSAAIATGQIATARGGTGVDSSALSGVASLSSGTWNTSSASKFQVTWCASGCTNSALTNSLGATTLCLAADCPAGFYHVVMYMYSTGTGCTTVGSGGVIPKLTYTDDVGAKSAVSGVNGGPNASGQGMAFTTGGAAASYVTWDIYTGGAQPIQVSTTLTACTTPGSFNGHNMRVTLWRVG